MDTFFTIRRLITFAILTVSTVAIGQSQFTKYDDIPGNIKSYKPAFQNDFPNWAKMLYSSGINYNTIKSEFDIWESEGTKAHRPIRRYYKIWSQKVLPYVNNDGTINLPDLESYNKNLFKIQKSKSSKNNIRSAGEWTFLGPKETYWLNETSPTTIPGRATYQVNVYSIDVAKTDNNVLYCGTETGFVNKSIDKGVSWNQLALDYNFGGGVTEIVIDPKDENIVYASAGNQTHKTIDGGISWSPLSSANASFSSDKIEIDKDDSSKLYAASNSGLYVSENAGMSWTRVHFSQVYDVHRHPSDQSIVYGLSKSGGNFELIISTDGGQSFSADSTFPQNIPNQSGGLLAVSQDSPDDIFVIMLSSDDTPLLYKGNVITQQWNLKATGNSSFFPMDNWQGFYDLVLEVSDENADIIYTGTASLFKSSNGGGTFANMGGYGGKYALHPDIQDMKIMQNGEVWVATDGGINYTDDNFITNHQVKTNGIIGSDMWGFDQSWNEDLVIGGRYHNGNTAIADFYGDKALRMGGAESPTGWVRQGKSRHVAFNDLGAGWILPKTAEAMPEGRFLFSKYPNMDEYGGRRSNMIFHTNYFGHILLGEGNAIWSSTNGGMEYDMIYDFGNRVRWIQASYSEPDIIYADIVNRGLQKSEDGGFTWQEKSSLTSFPNGNNNWEGRLFIAISPTDANTIYACLQNGTWSSDIGKVFKSTDGGDSWEDWTSGLSEYTKNIVVQPGENGEDIVYLFSNARDTESKVYVRNTDDLEWRDFSSGYPAGHHVNLALPFYRDSKLRVSGNAGVWESPLEVTNFTPIINPWVEQSMYGCISDTVYFEDHSIIDHSGATWRWEISPEPAFISDANVRNPMVVLGSEGSYDVTMRILKNGEEYSKTITDMISVTSCPSIQDCNNPATTPKNEWKLEYVDSEEPNAPGLAIMAFDDDPNTIWHTRWTSGNDTYPHEMIVDMGTEYQASKFTYLPRQNGSNGRVKEYELYVSLDGEDWGTPVSVGEFTNSFSPSNVDISPTICRYFRLVCLSEQNGNIWASAAEFYMTGCLADQVSTQNVQYENLISFPVPSSGYVNINIPNTGNYSYTITNTSGIIVGKGKLSSNIENGVSLDLSSEINGIYIIRLINEVGIKYTTKVVKI
jgi:photosystem II stability/assembly factor-like uncharacterized protein